MTQQIAEWFTALFSEHHVNAELAAFITSLFPILECRGGMIVAAALGANLVKSFFICYLGNMIPIPFILLFIRHILEWMKKVPKLDRIALWVESKAHKNKAKVLKFASFGLFLFVALPFPGTGAWTGALVAAMLDMRMKYALPSIFCGVVCAGFIMTLASYGFVSFLGFLT